MTIKRPAEEIFDYEPEELSVLQGYDWPGNIRKLRNDVEQAVVICEGARTQAEHLPESLELHEMQATFATETVQVHWNTFG